MHLLLLLLAAATLNVHASSTTETIVGRVSVDVMTTQDTSDTDLIPIPTDLAESISTTHEQFCDVTMLKKSQKTICSRSIQTRQVQVWSIRVCQGPLENRQSCR